MARDPFQDNRVILTGASSGIGRAMAEQLATRGARIVLAARREDRLRELAARCGSRGGHAVVLATDVGRRDDCRALVEGALEALGGIDTLIVNAGISMDARLDELETPEPIEEIMRVNYLGAAWCTYYALPHLQSAAGRIVGVSSLTGKHGVPRRTAYAASKHAMAGFFDSLRIELASSPMSVTVAYPGFVATEIRERARDAKGKPRGSSDIDEDAAMSAAECARHILQAAAERRRELVMTRKGKLGLWLKLLAPGLVDRMARRAIETGK